MSVELPSGLAGAVDDLLQDVSPRDLSRASAELSAKYREKRPHRAPVARSQPEILAYLAARLPATYAAITAALTAVGEQRPGWTPRSVLDLGAGPGTAIWSATAVWPSIERATAVEAEAGMLQAGLTLTRAASHPAVRSTTWVQADAAQPAPSGPYDLVLLGYVLGELDPSRLDRVVDLAAEATTPSGTAGRTLRVRLGSDTTRARCPRARAPARTRSA